MRIGPRRSCLRPDKFLKGQNANTAIVVEPQEGNFDLDFKKSIDWQTPTLQ
jgi:hypothetical protein